MPSTDCFEIASPTRVMAKMLRDAPSKTFEKSSRKLFGMPDLVPSTTTRMRSSRCARQHVIASAILHKRTHCWIKSQNPAKTGFEPNKSVVRGQIIIKRSAVRRSPNTTQLRHISKIKGLFSSLTSSRPSGRIGESRSQTVNGHIGR